jgi:hypothetical protein
MKKYLLIILLSASFHYLFAQTDSPADAQGDNKVQNEMVWNFATAKMPAFSGNHMRYIAPDVWGLTSGYSSGCVLCALNINRRIPGEQITVYKAKCEIHFLPGFESAANDNWDAVIDVNAVLCDSTRCADPDTNNGMPAIVKNNNEMPCQVLFTCYMHRVHLYSRNYPAQTGFRDIAGIAGYRRQNRLN